MLLLARNAMLAAGNLSWSGLSRPSIHPRARASVGRWILGTSPRMTQRGAYHAGAAWKWSVSFRSIALSSPTAPLFPSPCGDGSPSPRTRGEEDAPRLSARMQMIGVTGTRPSAVSRSARQVGVSSASATRITPTRNAIGLRSPVAFVANGLLGDLSPWRSVLPPRGGGKARAESLALGPGSRADARGRDDN